MAKLVLEDGTELLGESFGHISGACGEIVFQTGMVGYVESLTDPSYCGQILVLTYPHIGNYGVQKKSYTGDKLIQTPFQSEKVQVRGLIVGDYIDESSHWRAEQTLSQFLREERIPAITGIDTRALTKRLREEGTLLGQIVQPGGDVVSKIEDPNTRNLIEQVSCKVKTQLQDITERMSLLLTSYDGPSDLLSQRLALKRERENGKMKGALFDVLTDFNQIVNEREDMLASIKAWFDVSSKVLRGGESVEDPENAWGIVEMEMSNLMTMLEAFRNSSRDVSVLEHKLLKLVFKDTNVGDLDKVRNKIQLNSILKRNRPRSPLIVEKPSLEVESVEEIPSQVDVDAILKKYPKNPTAPKQTNTVEIQVDLSGGDRVEIQEKFAVKKQRRIKPIKKIDVESQTENSSEKPNSHETVLAESMPDLSNRSHPCLEVNISEIITGSNTTPSGSNAVDVSSSVKTRNGHNVHDSKQIARRLIPPSHQRTSTPSRSIDASTRSPSLRLKHSPSLSPVPPLHLQPHSRHGMTRLTEGSTPPNLSFMQREKIKHENIELYATKLPLKKYRLLTPLATASPKRHGAVRALGDIHLDSPQPAHVFRREEEEESAWGSNLFEFMKDMYVK